ncbi:MAG TPA: hypothetical protein VF596_18800 [Pyrinomonadaceae bacterium]|jgi:predicted transcriptional regulator
MTKETRINTRVSPQVADDLREVAEALEIPASQIIRQAVKEKIAEIKQTNPIFRVEKTGENEPTLV